MDLDTDEPNKLEGAEGYASLDSTKSSQRRKKGKGKGRKKKKKRR